MQHIIDLFKRECGSDWTLAELQALRDDLRGLLLESTHGSLAAYMLDLISSEEWEVPENSVLLEEIAVEKEWQGRGLGTLLVNECIRWSRLNKAPAIVAMCWESQQRYTSRVMLEKLGFRPIDFIEHAFVGAGCPYCGSDCTCAATILRMDLC